MREAVVIIDANGAIDAGGIDVLLRHADYGKQLLAISNMRYQLVIVGSPQLRKLALDNSVEDLIVLGPNSGRLRLSFIFRSLDRILAINSVTPRLFVFGDPWKSGFAGLLLRFTRYRNVPLQLQIHADFRAPGWKYQDFRHFLKFVFATFILSQYRIFRLVSAIQAKNMKTRNPLRLDIIPVTLSDTPNRLAGKKYDGKLTFGFFGRLHKDRGTEELIIIFNKILKPNSHLKLIIGGDGPEKSAVFNQLAFKFPKQVKMLGHVPEQGADSFWEDVDVLISLAPFESFGRTLRESLLQSRPVLAIPSSGVQDLMESAGTTWVELIEPNDSPEEILEKAERLAGLVDRVDLPENLKNPMDSSRQLAKAWIDIIG